MQTAMNKFVYEKLTANDLTAMRELMEVYALAFEDPASYRSKPPSDDYLRSILGKETFITVVAKDGEKVFAGLCAYVLEKFEQERSEIYIYDLAVSEDYRRRGAARGLINHLKKLAPSHRAWVIFVQADKTDDPAIKLYDSMGTREDVFHFDIDFV